MPRLRTRKSTFLTIMSSPFTIFFLLIVMLFVARGAFGINNKRIESREGLAGVAEEYSELEERRRQVERDIVRLKSEKGAEAELRNRFGVAKPGERVVVILENEEEAIELEGKTSRTFWQKIRDFFHM